MRLVVAACATAVVACVAVVGRRSGTQVLGIASRAAPEVATRRRRRPPRRWPSKSCRPAAAPVAAATPAPAAPAAPMRWRRPRPPKSRRRPPRRRAGGLKPRRRAASRALRRPLASAGASCPGNPNALGVARTVEIDTTGGPGFGFEHFKEHDFLREGEVVLTFDDGPWPKHTQAVLAALAAHCTKAIFFPIGAACHVRAGDHEAGGRRRTRSRLAHLVSPGPVEDQGQVPNKREDSKPTSTTPRTRSRRASARCAGRSADRPRRISAFPPCGSRRSSSPISASATSPCSPPTSIPSTSRCASPSRSARRS